MNKILILLFLFLSQNCFSQDIPKKANTIIIHGLTYQTVIDTLLERNFTIDKRDTALKTLVTNPRTIKSMTIIVSARVKDSSVIITGQVNFNIGITLGGVYTESSYDEIAYTGTMGSLYKKAFMILNNLALSFNKPIEYLIK